MPIFEVEIELRQKRLLTIFERTPDRAMKRAEQIVAKWDGVEGAVCTRCERLYKPAVKAKDITQRGPNGK